MEEFHWLPQDIHKIPYKDLQTFYLIRKQRVITKEDEVSLKAKIAHDTGQSKRI